MRTLHVVAALIVRDGKILLDRRGPGGALAGKWEFPGGKREPGETDEAALMRELEEELGVSAEIGAEISRVEHRTPDLELTLVLYDVEIAGEPEAIDVDEIAWFATDQLDALDMPPADKPLISVVQSLL